MILNYIWLFFFFVAFIVGLVKLIFFGDLDIFSKMMNDGFEGAKKAFFDISLPLVGIMSLWMGLMNIAEKAGAIHFIARVTGPFFSRLFPEVPRNHPAIGHIIMNFSANVLGLDNAATPLGLKAMQSLQEINPDKERASNAQIMFLVLNTSSLTVIPVSILALRAQAHAANPADVFIPILIATFCSTFVALLITCTRQRINLFNPVLFGGVTLITLLLAGLVVGLASLNPTKIGGVSATVGNLMIFLVIILFLAAGWRKKLNVFDSFVEGAKNGFETVLKFAPYLIALITAIAIFRASGAMQYLVEGISWCCFQVAMLFSDGSPDMRFVDALPTGFIKPLSGGGAKAMMIDVMNTKGPDSLAARISCIMQGAADTTFYIAAVYFGSVGIRKTRYAIPYGLLADLAGIIAAIIIGYYFFGGQPDPVFPAAK
ncbi:MAG: nucleoside recognition domain-containing protein [Bacteroidetes bacterium]|nr:MAG: nucleoside recognition domain-containing protein [Bacteroidota bacterium]